MHWEPIVSYSLDLGICQTRLFRDGNLWKLELTSSEDRLCFGPFEIGKIHQEFSSHTHIMHDSDAQIRGLSLVVEKLADWAASLTSGKTGYDLEDYALEKISRSVPVLSLLDMDFFFSPKYDAGHLEKVQKIEDLLQINGRISRNDEGIRRLIDDQDRPVAEKRLWRQVLWGRSAFLCLLGDGVENSQEETLLDYALRGEENLLRLTGGNKALDFGLEPVNQNEFDTLAKQIKDAWKAVAEAQETIPGFWMISDPIAD